MQHRTYPDIRLGTQGLDILLQRAQRILVLFDKSAMRSPTR